MLSYQLRLVAATVLVLGSSAAYAQSGNGSDISGPTQVPVTFAPLGVNNNNGNNNAPGVGASLSTPGAVAGVQTAFTSGAAVTSPATGQPIAPAAVRAVGALITSGSPTSVANIAAALTAAGAPSGAVSALTQALALLSGTNAETAPGAVLAAVKSFNALVASASADFLRNPPAEFLAIHAALMPMAASIGH